MKKMSLTVTKKKENPEPSEISSYQETQCYVKYTVK